MKNLNPRSLRWLMVALCGLWFLATLMDQPSGWRAWFYPSVAAGSLLAWTWMAARKR